MQHRRQLLLEKRMSFSSEFGEFALKGNVVDLAEGVIIGSELPKIQLVVGDLIQPIFSRFFGELLAYGSFIAIAINFIILAFIIFLMVKQMNKMKRAEPSPPPATTPEDVMLLCKIRDLLKK
jgi:large conductance mechanosensitive channel